jgi:ferrochelatase
MIWTSEGSPLLAHSVKQKTLLTGYLGQRVKEAGLAAELVVVELAMRYGNPPLDAAMDGLRAAGCNRILVVPLFPQYSASATASVLDAVYARAQRMRTRLRAIDSFHDDRAISALARASTILDAQRRTSAAASTVCAVRSIWAIRTIANARGGAPLATELGLERDQYVVTFQSRFGRARWLEPYTRDTLLALAKDGVRRVDVACPGFVADCLETLEEIGIEGKQAFLGAGGAEFHAIPCMNEHPLWIGALADLVHRHLQGWLVPPPDPTAAELTLARAKALGASR